MWPWGGGGAVGRGGIPLLPPPLPTSDKAHYVKLRKGVTSAGMPFRPTRYRFSSFAAPLHSDADRLRCDTGLWPSSRSAASSATRAPSCPTRSL